MSNAAIEALPVDALETLKTLIATDIATILNANVGDVADGYKNYIRSLPVVTANADAEVVLLETDCLCALRDANLRSNFWNIMINDSRTVKWSEALPSLPPNGNYSISKRQSLELLELIDDAVEMTKL